MKASIKRYGSFFLLALALGIAPGPDILFVLAQSLASGVSAGVLVTLGLCTGLCFHVAFAALGVAAFMKRFPALFKILTWCGAVYLVWLGFSTWREAGVVQVGTVVTPQLPMARLYLRGIVMNGLNPKVMLFFLALVPRFVAPERGRVTLQFVLLGLLFAAATLLVFNTVALCGGALSGFIASSPGSLRLLRIFSAFVMLGIAVWIGYMNLQGAHGVGKLSSRRGTRRAAQ